VAYFLEKSSGRRARTRSDSCQAVSGSCKSFHLNTGCGVHCSLSQRVLAGCSQDVITDLLAVPDESREWAMYVFLDEPVPSPGRPRMTTIAKAKKTSTGARHPRQFCLIQTQMSAPV
jgi:hypothetical protein